MSFYTLWTPAIFDHLVHLVFFQSLHLLPRSLLDLPTTAFSLILGFSIFSHPPSLVRLAPPSGCVGQKPAPGCVGWRRGSLPEEQQAETSAVLHTHRSLPRFGAGRLGCCVSSFVVQALVLPAWGSSLRELIGHRRFVSQTRQGSIPGPDRRAACGIQRFRNNLKPGPPPRSLAALIGPIPESCHPVAGPG